MASPTITLNDGKKIPVLGLGAAANALLVARYSLNPHAGTWQSPQGEVAKAVAYAIKECGYRHIDGAWMYKNEKEVGEGIRASGVPREEIFVRKPFRCVFGALSLNAWQITSKLWSTFHSRVEECLDQTLSASALLPLTQSSSPPCRRPRRGLC
jgi:glycerol 2-dehydrogenase (NADP+)